MPRYKLTVEYDGAPYQGWQWQDHGPSVQGVMEAAGAKLNKGDPVLVYGSGRTDSGVHALAQVAHMDLDADMREDKLRDAMNYHMMNDPVTVLAAEKMPKDWHARFDARERRYLYRINDRRMKLALDLGRVWRIPMKLDADAMHNASQVLVGTHDFSTFRDTRCQSKSPIKTIDEINVIRAAEEIHLTFKARSFLHKQVRSIVGSLAEVGTGKWTTKDMKVALEAKDRTECGPVAPSEGLYLVSVHY